MFRTIALLMIVVVALVKCAKEESSLIKRLLTDYNPLVRPVSDPTVPIGVDVGTYLVSARDFDEKKGVVTIAAWIAFRWNDTNLTWEPAENKNIQKVVLPSNLVWTPDANLYSEKAVWELNLSSAPDNLLSIESNGEVNNVFTVRVTFPMQKTDKGFETTFLVEPGNLDKTLQIFHINSNTMNLKLFNENPQYKLKGNKVEVRNNNYPDDPDEIFSGVEVTLNFEKK